MKPRIAIAAAVIVLVGGIVFFLTSREAPKPKGAAHVLPAALEAALVSRILPELTKLDRPFDVVFARSQQPEDAAWLAALERECAALNMRVTSFDDAELTKRIGEAAAVYAVEPERQRDVSRQAHVVSLTPVLAAVEAGDATVYLGERAGRPEIVLSKSSAKSAGLTVSPTLGQLARLVE